ncbi:hypothetical protein AB0911_35150 [Streptomyces nigra]|uniref:hypothetical protein n=1 Tax=Streptomyces nigra TaxID=1827580 RepID=UPI003454E432
MVTTVAAFTLCLWGGKTLPFEWLPRDEGDRWMVATAFATVAASVTATALGWWAQHVQDEPPVVQPSYVSQHATAADHSSAVQTGGDENSPGSGRARPCHVEQRATASGHGRIVQVGGDQYLAPAGDGERP